MKKEKSFFENKNHDMKKGKKFLENKYRALEKEKRKMYWAYLFLLKMPQHAFWKTPLKKEIEMSEKQISHSQALLAREKEFFTYLPKQGKAKKGKPHSLPFLNLNLNFNVFFH